MELIITGTILIIGKTPVIPACNPTIPSNATTTMVGIKNQRRSTGRLSATSNAIPQENALADISLYGVKSYPC